MKKITLLALSLCLTLGVFAQNNINRAKSIETTPSKVLKQAGQRGEFKAKQFPFKNASSTISNVSMPEVTTSGDYSLGFCLTFDVTMNADGTKFYYDVFQAGALESFVDTSSNFSTMEEYLLYEANYYAQNGSDYWETEDGQGVWPRLYGDTEYEIYVLTVGADTSDAYVTTYTFTTPSSVWSGTPALSVSRVDNVDEGTISWTVTPNNNTREFYFLAEAQEEALYWLNNYPDHFSSNEESYEYELSYWATGNYSSYFTFTREDDVNSMFDEDFSSEDGLYIEGEDYVWMYMAVNGNGEAGDFTYAEFVYGDGSSLNDVAELMNAVVYPNPARDYVNISSKVNMTKVELYNTLGQVVYTSNVNANVANVPVSSLNNGTYFVKAYADGVVVTKKIVIE